MKLKVAAGQLELESPLAIAVRCGRADLVARLLRCGLSLESRSKVLTHPCVNERCECPSGPLTLACCANLMDRNAFEMCSSTEAW